MESPSSNPRPGLEFANNLGGLLLAALVLFVICAQGLPENIKARDAAKEAEVKQNLHDIQLTVERFACDTSGEYPQYLIGGAPTYGDAVVGPEKGQINYNDNSVIELSNIQNITTAYSLSDPLLRLGYMDSYPNNPFVRYPIAIHRYQVDVDDPLSNVSVGRGVVPPSINDSKGTRFGGNCRIMGQVLADFRFTQFFFKVPGKAMKLAPSFADKGYQQFDQWAENIPELFLPGTFFYKSNGPYVIARISQNIKPNIGDKAKAGVPNAPSQINQYMLGAYGSLRTQGEDILGPEQPIDIPLGSGEINKFHPWTRSENESGHNLGDPYGLPKPGKIEYFSFGNPNGIKDAIILTLNSGPMEFDNLMY